MQTPPIPPADEFRFHTLRRTRWCDEDNQRVVNNAVYMTLLEEARHQYFSELDLLAENQFPFVLAQTNIRFLNPGVGGCELRIDLRTTHLGKSSFTQCYRIGETRISEAQSPRVLCEAQALLVAWDNSTRAQALMSTEFRAALAGFEGLDADLDP